MKNMLPETELENALLRIKELESQQAPKPAPAPVIQMLRFDKWKGQLVVLKQKRHPGTGQTFVTQMRFDISDTKPVGSCSVPQKVADLWNSTRFTARAQASELLFPAGIRTVRHWDLTPETEEWEVSEKPLETA